MSRPTIQPNRYNTEAFARVSKTAYFLAAIFLFLVPAAMLVDLPVAKSALDERLPGDVYRLVNFSEVFAHGLGVAVICLLIYALDPHNRRCLLRIAACTFGAGLLANVVKLVVARQRPHAFLHQPEAIGATVWDTFIVWMPHLSPTADAGSHAFQSFPSGHTATAVAFAFALAWRYPRGRWLFALFALMAACQRIAASAHYLSDTLAGAAVGTMLIGLSFDCRLIPVTNRLLRRDSKNCGNQQPRSRDAA